MSKSKKVAADALVAKADIAIDGIHYAAGEPVTGADPEQVRLAHAAGRLMSKAEFIASRTAPVAEEPAGEAEPKDGAAGEPEGSTADEAEA
jgi:hypothetical protein